MVDIPRHLPMSEAGIRQDAKAAANERTRHFFVCVRPQHANVVILGEDGTTVMGLSTHDFVPPGSRHRGVQFNADQVMGRCTWFRFDKLEAGWYERVMAAQATMAEAARKNALHYDSKLDSVGGIHCLAHTCMLAMAALDRELDWDTQAGTRELEEALVKNGAVQVQPFEIPRRSRL